MRHGKVPVEAWHAKLCACLAEDLPDWWRFEGSRLISLASADLPVSFLRTACQRLYR